MKLKNIFKLIKSLLSCLITVKILSDKILIKIFGVKITIKKVVSAAIIYSKKPFLNKKNILVHLYGAHTAVPAIASIKNLYKEEINVYVLVTPFTVKGEKATINILKNFKEIKKVYRLDMKTISAIENCALPDNYLFFNKMFKGIKFEAIVYGHDINNSLISIIGEIYPDAKNISYGDGFLGFFYNKKTFLEKRGYEESFIQNIKIVNPDIYSAFLAFDMHGGLDSKKLRIIPKNLLTEFSKKVTTEALDKFIKKIIKIYTNSKKVILLTENLSEGGFMSYENEIKMYVHFIEKYIAPKSLIIIKNHPHDENNKFDAIKNRLNNKYFFTKLPNSISYYPLELLHELVKNADIIISNGTPPISIPYFYNKDVIAPIFEDESIEQYFDDKVEVMRLKKELKNCLYGYMHQDRKSFINPSAEMIKSS